MTVNPSRRALDELLALAGRMADAAREPLLRHDREAGFRIDNKQPGGFDPVTSADREAERAMREVLGEARPGDCVIGEEFGESPGDSGLTWVIDPLDGTRSFLAGFPLWTVLIGLHDGARPILGIIDQPYLEERYWGLVQGTVREAGFRGRGLAQPLRTRDCAALAQATIATTHYDAFAGDADFQAFRRLERRCRFSRHGGDAYQYAALARGRLDLVVESGLQSYDVMAVVPVIEGAGGVATDWSGGDCAWGGPVLAAGSEPVHRAAMEVLSGG